MALKPAPTVPPSIRSRGRTTYLVDKSAWEQLRYSEAARRKLAKLHENDEVAVHTVIVAELLFSARTYEDFLSQRDDYRQLRWLDTPPPAEVRAIDVMQELARHGHHRSVGVADLLVAAVAEVHGAVVLHYDSDFERIAAVTGQSHEWIVPRGDGHRDEGETSRR